MENNTEDGKWVENCTMHGADAVIELTIFFTPILSSYTSLLLDGTARNFSFFLSTWICKSMQFIVSGFNYVS